MSDNVIEIAVVASTQQLTEQMQQGSAVISTETDKWQTAFRELQEQSTADIERLEIKIAELEERISTVGPSFENASSKSREAMHAMGLSMEATGVGISRHLRAVINEVPLLSKAFELAFPVFAITAGIEILAKFGEKIGELISKTFIFTDAMKEQDKEMRIANKNLEVAADRVKALGREYALAAEQTAIGKEKLKLAFIFEDLGGSPQKLRAKLDDVLGEFNRLSSALNQPNRFAVPDALKQLGFSNEDPGNRVDDAKAKLAALAEEILHLRAAIQVGDAEAKNINQAIQNDLTEQADKAAKSFAQLGEKVKTAFNEMKQAQKELSSSQSRLDEDMFKAYTHGIAQETSEAMAAADRRMKGKLEEFKENRRLLEENAVLEKDHEISLSQIAQQRLAFDLQLGRIGETEYEKRLQEQLAKSLKVEAAILTAKRAFAQGNVIEQRRIDLELQKLQDKYRLDVERADQQSYMRRIAMARSAFQQIGGSFRNEVLSVIQGTETIGQAFSKLYQDLITGLASYVLQKGEKKAEEWAIDKLFHIKSTTSATAAAAGVAMAAAFASVIQALPFPENVGAAPGVAAAAGATATGLGLGGLAFERGGIVPADSLAMVHKREMILPASLSQFVQSAAQNAGGGETRVGNHSFYISTVDARGFERMLKRNAPSVKRATKEILRKAGVRT